MGLIKGIPIVLYDRQEVARDDFNAPVYEETEVIIDNVIIAPASTQDIVEALDLHGKKVEYELCIPKGDDNEWVNRRVKFYNEVWETVGVPQEFLRTPLEWNRKVRVCRYE